MMLLILAITTYFLIFTSTIIDVVDIHYLDESYKMMLKKMNKDINGNIKKSEKRIMR